MFKIYQGACHCGAVRFEATLDFDAEPVIDCSCSICRKKGILHIIVQPDRFKLLAGDEHLTTYRFNTGQAIHRFCARCGIHPFYTPRSHPDSIDINVRCIDDAPWDTLRIEPFDGANWEDNIDALRADVP